MSRKSARSKVYVLLYEYGANKEENEFTLDLALLDASLTDEDKEFILTYYKDLQIHYDELADLIMEFVPKYSSIDRLLSTDRTALILAAYELVYHKDIDIKIIINEAVDTAKQYGADKSSGFVNGVLANVAKKVRGDDN